MVNVIDVIKDMTVAIPIIIVAVQTLTAALKGIFTIENDNWKRAIALIIGVLCGCGFVLFNGLDFGVSTGWNYVLGAASGFIAGAAASGLYGWPKIKAFFTAITEIFGGKNNEK